MVYRDCAVRTFLKFTLFSCKKRLCASCIKGEVDS